MVSRQMERFGGLFIATIGAILTLWNWQIAIYEGHFYMNAAFLGPAFTVMGLGLVIFPGYRTERIARGEDISQLTGSAMLTPRWWGILAISIGSGLANYGVLSNWKI
jgi:hypothetical protein